MRAKGVPSEATVFPRRASLPLWEYRLELHVCANDECFLCHRSAKNKRPAKKESVLVSVHVHLILSANCYNPSPIMILIRVKCVTDVLPPPSKENTHMSLMLVAAFSSDAQPRGPRGKNWAFMVTSGSIWPWNWLVYWLSVCLCGQWSSSRLVFMSTEGLCLSEVEQQHKVVNFSSFFLILIISLSSLVYLPIYSLFLSISS